MAIEPERPIEKLLREAAARRRADAGEPPELHPATRRLLQGEVARVYSRPREAGGSAFPLARFWPRFAWSLAIFIVLAIGAWIWLPGSGQRPADLSLAKNEPGNREIAVRDEQAPEALADRRAARTLAETPVAAPAAAPALAPPAEGPLTLAPGQPGAAEPGKPLLFAGSELAQKEKAASEALKPTPAGSSLAAASQPAASARQPKAQMVNAPSSSPAVSAPAPQTSALSQRYGLAGRPAAPTDSGSAALADAVANSAKPATAKSEIPGPNPVRTLTETDAYKRSSETAGTANLAFRSLPMTRTKVASPKDTAPAPFAQEGKKAGTGAAVAVQRFTQVSGLPAPARPDGAAAVRPVLTSFALEQNGHELRIVEDDGSVYLGSVEATDVSWRRRAVNTETAGGARTYDAPQPNLDKVPAAGTALAKQAAQSYFFRVSGTNRSLKQPLVFSGQLIATNGPARAGTPAEAMVGGTASGGAIQTSPGPFLALPLSNLRISGKAQIGRAQEIEIHAVPVRP